MMARNAVRRMTRTTELMIESQWISELAGKKRQAGTVHPIAVFDVGLVPRNAVAKLDTWDWLRFKKRRCRNVQHVPVIARYVDAHDRVAIVAFDRKVNVLVDELVPGMRLPCPNTISTSLSLSPTYPQAGIPSPVSAVLLVDGLFKSSIS